MVPNTVSYTDPYMVPYTDPYTDPHLPQMLGDMELIIGMGNAVHHYSPRDTKIRHGSVYGPVYGSVYEPVQYLEYSPGDARRGNAPAMPPSLRHCIEPGRPSKPPRSAPVPSRRSIRLGVSYGSVYTGQYTDPHTVPYTGPYTGISSCAVEAIHKVPTSRVQRSDTDPYIRFRMAPRWVVGQERPSTVLIP